MATLSSLWLDSADRPARPALDRDVHVDVCVIGAGISGLSAAFELQRRGASVAVLEARFVAAGASGYNTAKLSSLHGPTYARLERDVGARGARLYAEANESGIARVFALAEELEIECDLRRKPNLVYSETGAATAASSRRRWRRRAVPGWRQSWSRGWTCPTRWPPRCAWPTRPSSIRCATSRAWPLRWRNAARACSSGRS